VAAGPAWPAAVSTRKISDQLGHSKVSMTQDRYLGRRRPADREGAGGAVRRGRTGKESQRCPWILTRGYIQAQGQAVGWAPRGSNP